MPKGLRFPARLRSGSPRRYSVSTAFCFRSLFARRFSVRNWFSFVFFLIFSFTALDLLAQVNQAWVALYNGPGDGDDAASALAVDGSGNVYVTGYSGVYPNLDYATIKYAPNGDTLWVRRYNGTGNLIDDAFALAVDNSGNVYVTGGAIYYDSECDCNDRDYATIKYSSAGNTLWVTRYNGTGNDADAASALAVDGSGNVYVTGTSSNGADYDYATIKYAPNGDTLWVRRYNSGGSDGASALTVDGSGNVYVTGSSGTIKYSANGDFLWFAVYGGNDLAIDASGNVYVTGMSGGDYATIKYAPNGDTLWVRSHTSGAEPDYQPGPSLTVDGSGNVYVAGSYNNSAYTTYHDYVTIKYSPNGELLWYNLYDKGQDEDFATAITVDVGGNVYVTGAGTYLFSDYVTIKYAPDGNTLWVDGWNWEINGHDYPSAIEVDGSGNVYVTGRSWGSFGPYHDYATIKYSPAAAAKGDMDGDGGLSPADVVLMLNCVFLGTGTCILSIADVNCSGSLTPGDAALELMAVFVQRPFPC